MSRPRLALRLASGLTAIILLTAGCGGDGDESGGEPEAPANDVPAATGTTIETENYSFSAPEGWEENDGQSLGAMAASIDVFVVDPADSDGFVDNINVIEEPQLAGFDDLDDRVDAAKQGLSLLDTEELVVGDPVTLDGEDAAVISTVANQAGASNALIQYYVTHDDTGYVVTFSYSTDRPQSEQDEIAKSVAASWSWAS